MPEGTVFLRSPFNGDILEVSPDHPLWPMVDVLQKRGFTRVDDDKPVKKDKRERPPAA